MLAGLTRNLCQQAIPDNILINGRNTYDCELAELEEGAECDSEADLSSFVFIPGRRYRLRIINAGSLSNMMFSIDNHKMTIIEVISQIISSNSEL